ncbi:MAG: cytochrome c [Nitrospirae bacterium]|nr:cytochrome c [Nitrospirota bacterium]
MSKGGKFTILALTVAFGFVLVASQSWAGDAAKGEKVFKANCVVCHGDKGDGKGPAAAPLTPKPRNFTDANEMKGIDDARLHKSILEGRPGTAMVSFAKTLSAGDIEDVIAYLKTLLKK